MKNIFRILLFIISIFIFSCAKKEEDSENFLVLGTSPIFPPFSYIKHGAALDDENIIGFDIELAKEIANKRGKELIVKSMYFDELIPALQNGDVDIVISAMSITKERQNLVDFSITYYEASQVVLIRNNDETFVDIYTKEALGENKKLASLLGSTGSIIAKNIAKDGTIDELKSWELAIDELLSEKIDAIIVDRAPAKVFIDEHSGLLKILNIDFEMEHYSVAVAKENRELLASVNDVISRLVNSGDYIKLVDEFINHYSEN